MADTTPDQGVPFAALASKLELICSRANWLAYIAVAAMPVLICADVVGRLLHTGVPGALELQENLLVLTTYGLIAWLQSRDQHMSIDFVYKRFSGGMKSWADVFVSGMTFIILAVLSWESLPDLPHQDGHAVHGAVPPAGNLLLDARVRSDPDPARGGAPGCSPYRRRIPGRPSAERGACLAAAALLVYMPFWYRESDYEVSNLVLGLIAFALLFFFLFMKMPIGWTMCTIGALGCIAIYRSVNAALAVVGSTPYSATASYNLVALPLFVLMGCMILYSGISVDLFNSANKWIGHLPGGMGMAGVAGCTGFAAVCGDSLSTAVTMGSVSLPEMQRLRYDPALSTGSLAAGGTLGILIPPSSGFIIYGIVTEVSIGRLFMAGLIPGLMLAGMFMLYIYIMAVRHPEMAPRGPKYTLAEKVRSSTGLLPILALFVLVLGSIVVGICSPTEGGAVGVAGAFLYALARRKLNRRNLLASLEETAILTSRHHVHHDGRGRAGLLLRAVPPALPAGGLHPVPGIQQVRHFRDHRRHLHYSRLHDERDSHAHADHSFPFPHHSGHGLRPGVVRRGVGHDHGNGPDYPAGGRGGVRPVRGDQGYSHGNHIQGNRALCGADGSRRDHRDCLPAARNLAAVYPDGA